MLNVNIINGLFKSIWQHALLFRHTNYGRIIGDVKAPLRFDEIDETNAKLLTEMMEKWNTITVNFMNLNVYDYKQLEDGRYLLKVREASISTVDTIFDKYIKYNFKRLYGFDVIIEYKW